MVEEFSRRLTEELNKLLTDNNLRGRAGTTDTARISIDSIRPAMHTFDESVIDDILSTKTTNM
jgi:hypothetical protein